MAAKTTVKKPGESAAKTVNKQANKSASRASGKTAVKTTVQSIAVLCSGGDAPGMNAALRAIVRSGIYHGLDVYGVHKGFSGLLEGNIDRMSLRSVANIIQRGGTILKTDRCKAFYKKEVRAEAVHILRRKEIDALLVIGGEGTYTGAHLLHQETRFPVVGIPGTIDNDIFGSEYSIGFDTAINTGLEAIDRIRDTASSHDRVFFVEVMGRASAEIALHVGLGGGAETILLPEQGWGSRSAKNYSAVLDKLCKTLKKSSDQGKLSSIVIVAEGDSPGFTYQIAEDLKQRAKIDSRVAILGHIQRGGTPSARDRSMASLMGAKAVSAIIEGKTDVAVGVVSGKIALIPLKTAIGKHKKTDQELLRLAEVLAS